MLCVFRMCVTFAEKLPFGVCFFSRRIKMRRSICGSTEESSWRNWLKRLWKRSGWIAIWPSGRCAEWVWFWRRVKSRYLLLYSNLLCGTHGCFSQIINRKKTLADMREEYGQELLSECRTDRQLACDEASPKQNLWVKATVILVHQHPRVKTMHSKWKFLISRQKTEAEIIE